MIVWFCFVLIGCLTFLRYIEIETVKACEYIDSLDFDEFRQYQVECYKDKYK